MARCLQSSLTGGEILLTANNDKELKKELSRLINEDVTKLQQIEEFVGPISLEYTQPRLDRLIKNMMSQPISTLSKIQKLDIDNSFRIIDSFKEHTITVRHPATGDTFQISLDFLAGASLTDLMNTPYRVFGPNGEATDKNNKPFIKQGIKTMYDLYEALGGMFTIGTEYVKSDTNVKLDLKKTIRASLKETSEKQAKAFTITQLNKILTPRLLAKQTTDKVRKYLALLESDVELIDNQGNIISSLLSLTDYSLDHIRNALNVIHEIHKGVNKNKISSKFITDNDYVRDIENIGKEIKEAIKDNSETTKEELIQKLKNIANQAAQDYKDKAREKFDSTDISWEYLARIELLSTNSEGKQLLKNKYVAQALPKSTVKMGQRNMMSNNAWVDTDTKLIFAKQDSKTYGSQLYAGTEKKKEVKVTGSTQALTATGFGGRMGLRIYQMNNAMAFLIEEGLNELGAKVQNGVKTYSTEDINAKVVNTLAELKEFFNNAQSRSLSDDFQRVVLNIKPNEKKRASKFLLSTIIPANIQFEKDSFDTFTNLFNYKSTTFKKLKGQHIQPIQQLKLPIEKLGDDRDELVTIVRKMLISKISESDISQASELLKNEDPNFNNNQLRELLVTQLNSYFTKHSVREKYKGGQYVISPQTTAIYEVTLPDGRVKRYAGYFQALNSAKRAWKDNQDTDIDFGKFLKTKISKPRRLKGGNMKFKIVQEGQTLEKDFFDTNIFKLLKDAFTDKNNARRANDIEAFREAKAKHEGILGLANYTVKQFAQEGVFIDYNNDLTVREQYPIEKDSLKVTPFEIGLKLKDEDIQQFGIKPWMQPDDIDLDHFKRLVRKEKGLLFNEENISQDEVDIEKKAKALYNSFQRIIEMTVSRTPGQDLQSILGGKVAFITKGSDNNIEAPMELEYFQGADQDIDKGSIPMMEAENGKVISWHPDMYDNLDNPDVMRLPFVFKTDYKLEENADKVSSIVADIMPKYDEKELIEAIKTSNNLGIQAQIKLGKYKTFNIDDKKVVEALKEKQKWKPTRKGARNFITRFLFDAVVLPENAFQAQTAMTMDDLDMEATNASKGRLRNPKNRYSAAAQDIAKNDNNKGKLTIGIAATLIKTTGIFQNAYNELMRNSNFLFRNTLTPLRVTDENGKMVEYQAIPNLNYKNLSLNTSDDNLKYFIEVIQSSKYDPPTIPINGEMFNKAYVLSVLGNALSTKKGSKKRIEAMKKVRSVLSDFASFEATVTFLESQFLSAATDNAKELILEKINADVRTAGFFGSMLFRGVPIDVAIGVMTHPMFEYIVSETDTDLGQGTIEMSDFIESIDVEEEDVLANNLKETLLTLNNINEQNRLVAKIASLNQGTPNSFYAQLSYLSQIKKSHQKITKDEDYISLTAVLEQILEVTPENLSPHLHINLIASNPNYKALVKGLNTLVRVQRTLSSANDLALQIAERIKAKNTEEDIKSYLRFLSDVQLISFLKSNSPTIKKMKKLTRAKLYSSEGATELKKILQDAILENKNQLAYFGGYIAEDNTKALYPETSSEINLKPSIVIDSNDPIELEINISLMRAAFKKDANTKIEIGGQKFDFKDILFVYDQLVTRGSMRTDSFARVMVLNDWKIFEDFNELGKNLNDTFNIQTYLDEDKNYFTDDFHLQFTEVYGVETFVKENEKSNDFLYDYEGYDTEEKYEKYDDYLSLKMLKSVEPVAGIVTKKAKTKIEKNDFILQIEKLFETPKTELIC